MELFLSALIVMVVGMGFVFAFLFIQVWATDRFAKIAAKYSYLLPEPEKPVARKPAAAAANDGEVAAAIVAALKQSGKLPL